MNLTTSESLAAHHATSTYLVFFFTFPCIFDRSVLRKKERFRIHTYIYIYILCDMNYNYMFFIHPLEVSSEKTRPGDLMLPDADIMVDGNDIWAPHPDAASSGNLAKTSQPLVMEDAKSDW